MNRLDLHRVRHADARNLVIRFIEDNWHRTGTEIEIITGNSPEMRDVVKSVLDEYSLEYQIGRRFDMNKGYMVVRLD
jgi:DNA-nicking Smr family endonuclease